jgi:saccharopine dehydrogenase (NADP+, L-glutamate forming)
MARLSLDGHGQVIISLSRLYFVARPNRDSTPYKEKYNIPEIQTIIPGFPSYQDFPQFVRVLVETGFLEAAQEALSTPLLWKRRPSTLSEPPR